MVLKCRGSLAEGEQKSRLRKAGKRELGVMSRKLAFYPRTEKNRQGLNLEDLAVRKTALVDM